MANRDVLLRSLDFFPLTREGEKLGVEIYRQFFNSMPEMMSFYHLPAEFNGDAAIDADRFQKLGYKLGLAVHIFANIADQPDTIRAYAREQVLRHIQRKVSPRFFRGFFDVLLDWMRTKTQVSDEVVAEWHKVGDIFATEAVKYADELGLVFEKDTK